ncbi:MAG TPA: amidohydrolase family protein [Streptosporangiaceae bacterium]|nr:amidohydrolase family protein [Streptosporangiaceae bacterium]
MAGIPVIDVHAHAVLPASLGAAGAAGPELGATDGVPWFRVGEYLLHGVRYRDSPFMDVGLRLREMDRHGIDIQLLSPNPLTYFGDLDAASAVAYCRAHNDDLAAIVSAHPGRLLGAAQLPMQDIDAAVAELGRAVTELGLRAAYIDTDPGRPLDDPAMDDFYTAVTDLDVPLFVHPTSISDGGPPADPRLRRLDLDLLVGFAYQETLAVAALVIGGVLDRHPRLDVCLSHGGGAIGSLAGRFESAARARAWSGERLRAEGFTSYLRRLWFDTHVHGDRVLAGLAELVGPGQLVYGSNFAGWDAEEPGSLPQAPGLDLTANARRLLRLG